MNPANPMKTLYDRLAKTGIDRKFVRTTILPDWWEDEIAQNPTGYAQAMTLLSRCLYIDLKSLQDAREIAYKEPGLARFKKSGKVTEQELEWAKRLSVRALQIACSAFDKPVGVIPESASIIRQQILQRGARSVSLDVLLDYCWDIGIPVLHISAFPQRARKMDGLSARINGRPAIVISKNFKYSAWLLFILAHELGHIARNHLHGNDILVDDRVEKETFEMDAEESEANSFAKEILTGNPRVQYDSNKNLTALYLAQNAHRIYLRHRIDPGVIALNYAFGKDRWGVGLAALQLLEPNAKAIETIRSKFLERLNWNHLPEDTAEFLRRITGTNAQP